jgi:glycosyltransferase involved in cell wall biosynthesis/2-polyprenyl-3-methyl-5-hydroxy-6-metoxy-1,4-benzoquinol methylase
MDVVIHSLGMPFNGETIQKQSLGGSESAAYYQARELARRGHRVTMFTTCVEEGHFEGVNYCFAGECKESSPLGERFEFYARNTPHDVLIIQRHPHAFHEPFASKVNIWQLHDLALHRAAGMANHGMWQTDFVTCVSEWHKKQVCEVYGFDPDFVRVVPNGVDEALYAGDALAEISADAAWVRAQQMKRDGKFVMLYQSRPERGLEHLVRPGGIMDRLRDTNAHLLVCAYDNTMPQMVHFYGMLHRWADALPNVTMLGALTKAQLAALQKSCDLLVYPTNGFEEVSCITAMEAMHAGLPMLASDAGALAETCKDAGAALLPLKDGKADEDAFVGWLVSALADERNASLNSGDFREKQLEAAKTRTWSAAVDRLEAVIWEALTKRKGTRAAVVRHGIEHSDVKFAWEADPILIEGGNAIESKAREEIRQLYAFADSPAAYKAHYDKHQSTYYDDFEDQVIGEDVTRTTRFQGVSSLIQQEAQGDKPLRIMDYGCAHGHYMMPLAKSLPSCRFVGVDVSARAISAAFKWATRDSIHNIELRLGGQEVFDSLETLCPLIYDEDSYQIDGTTGQAVAKRAHRQLFDVILAGEVVEHVPDWLALLEHFRNVLKPGGLLVITTPVGRWEWTGTEAFRKAREHLHHFERHDIEELCGRNPVQILYAPASHDKTGKVLGSWVWGVRPSEPFQMYDVERKRAQLAPRETVSACLIVKDGEKTLRKCVDSFVDWVDEIVIAVDPKTKDRTFDLIDQIRDDYRWKPVTLIPGLSALDEGFDAARNRTVESASGDWIMWIDADEEIQQPWNMWKYLRPSQHKAYGFPQMHYSANPPGVLTTDFPCRLFRNRAGIQFYGIVHEHPEVEPGKAIPRSAIRHDVQFLHNGYVDEETRRKRYQRNLPLLHRDLEKYPTRGLNRFLWLRDIAQGLIFEHEQTQGQVIEGQPERAREGIALYEQIIEKDPIRMAIDSLKYYSHCVETLGGGFEFEVSYKSGTQAAPDLACNMQFNGRFASIKHYELLMNKIHQEATRHYDSKYL